MYNLLYQILKRRIIKLNFEESLKKLEEMTDKIRRDDTSLEDAIKCYEEGLKCYNECNEILKTAKQNIEVIRREEA